MYRACVKMTSRVGKHESSYCLDSILFMINMSRDTMSVSHEVILQPTKSTTAIRKCLEYFKIITRSSDMRRTCLEYF